MRVSLVLSFFQTIVVTRAIGFRAPRQTSIANDSPSEVGWSPKPTTIAALQLLNQDGLARRQASTDLRTCGYVSGWGTDALTCSTGYACASEAPNFFGCCSTIGEGFAPGCSTYTGCYDYSTATACVGDCFTHNRVCDSTLPYCVEFVLQYPTTTLTHYECTTDLERTVIVSPTPTDLTSFTFTSSPVVSSPSTTKPTSSSSSTSTSTTQSSTTQTPPPTPTPQPSGGGSSTNVGAIAGGVVGGVAGLAIIGAIIYLLVRRKQNQIGAQMSEIQT